MVRTRALATLMGLQSLFTERIYNSFRYVDLRVFMATSLTHY